MPASRSRDRPTAVRAACNGHVRSLGHTVRVAGLPETLGTTGIVRERCADSYELGTAISGRSVPELPCPEDGLAKALAALSPPTALTFSTPWVRVPVTAPPVVGEEDARQHQEGAHDIWLAGWPAARRRRNRALEDRSTVGARYNVLASFYPWLTLTLERERVGWDQALLLAESLTNPPVDWFDLEQAATNGGSLQPWSGWARTTTDVNGPKEPALTAYRHVSLAVLHDVGAESTIGLGPYPMDRHGLPSRLVWAGTVHGVTNPAGTHPERGAAKALKRGRRLLHALGAWPWALATDGMLTGAWQEEQLFTESLEAWCRRGEMREASAQRARATARRDAGLDRVRR